MFNKLLERQIRRFLKNTPEIPEEFQSIFKAISDSYDHYESQSSLLERSIDISSKELNDANDSLKDANLVIEEKNKDIMDSIKYAKRIQDAILPTEKLLKESLDGSFILFKPKDIVSGDFYWVEKKDGKIIVAAVDCTGHGVPGAFMSMIGNALLNEIVKEHGITQPDEILNHLRDGVISALKQKGEEGDTKDGMDIALCTYDLGSMNLNYAGANNPLYLIRNNELLEEKPDKQPIGYFLDELTPFTNVNLEIKKGDTIYIFSDGYADQFGGPKGKKFKYRPFKELLLSLQGTPMKEQRDVLDKTIEDWKGELEQIDDICILGVKI